MLCNRPARALGEPEVSSTARTNSGLLRRRVHGRKYDVRVLDAFGYVGREEEISAAAHLGLTHIHSLTLTLTLNFFIIIVIVVIIIVISNHQPPLSKPDSQWV